MIQIILETDILRFAIDDVQRQVCALKHRGEIPTRVRISIGHERLLMVSLSSMQNFMVGVVQRAPSICGLPLLVDGDWTGPLTVETTRDQKPFQP